MSEVDKIVQFQIAIPEDFRDVGTRGLLGTWNDDATDDLLPRFTSTPLASTAAAEEIFFSFGESCTQTRIKYKTNLLTEIYYRASYCCRDSVCIHVLRTIPGCQQS